MKLLRLLLVLSGILLVLAIAAIWWNWPRKIDMANYAPADALVYIELNSIADITKAIQQGEAFKTVSSVIGLTPTTEKPWAVWAARAGIAPAQSVLFSRSQMALIVTGIDRQTTDQTIRIKPEAALIVETQTSKWRIKSVVIDYLRQLSEFAYGTNGCKERAANSDYIDCIEPAGSRKIVAAIDGSTVIIANSEKAVESCLEVRHGKRPGLATDGEFNQTRKRMSGESALAFGYVSQANAARIVSLGIPLLVGKEPGDSQFEKLLADSATRILRGFSWTTTSTPSMIEDHYQISLDPDVAKRLEPVFQIAQDDETVWQLVPDSFRALTVYRSSEPYAAWSSLNSALALKLDAVSTVLISSLLKASLSGYGMENPKDFLGAMTAPLMTIRPALGEESLLLARVKDETQLRNAFKTLIEQGKGQILNGAQEQPNREREFTALFTSGFVVLGKTENILVYLDQLRNKETVAPTRAETLSLSKHPGSAVVTYTVERDLVQSVTTAVARLRGQTISENAMQEIRSRLANTSMSSTESRLNESGIDRRTQSPFGQFGNLISLALADSSTSKRQ